MKFFPAILLVLSLHGWVSPSQAQEEDLYQLSGLALDSKGKFPLPYVNIIVKGTNRGAVSDLRGFFSIVVKPYDTLIFSEVGYKKQLYIVPDTLKGYKQSIAVYLLQDTILLDEAIIYPWPEKTEFKEAFLELQVSSAKDRIAPYSGFKRIDNPVEPTPNLFNPVSLFYEKVVEKIKYNSRKRKKAKELPKWKE